MSTYKRFEDLPVWKKSAELAAGIFRWTAQSAFRGKGDLANQIQRATLSISNNIAEGFERGSTADLLKFLYIARGSAGEVRSMLCVMELMSEFDELKNEITSYKIEFESVGRQIRGWANQLQNSEIKGQRHLNDESKSNYERKQNRSKVLAELAEFRKNFEKELNKKAGLLDDENEDLKSEI